MIRIWIVLGLIFFNHTIYSNILELSANHDDYDVSDKLLFFEDESQNLKFEDILKPEIQNKFVSNKKKIPDFGLTNSTVWGKFQYSDLTVDNVDWYLMYYFNLNQLDVYIQDKSGHFKLYTEGLDFPFNKRHYNFNQYLFPLEHGGGLHNVYFKTKSSTDKIILSLRILSPMGLVNFAKIDTLIHSIYIGIILAMFIYNFFVFITIRDLTYGYYILYLFFTCFSYLLGFNFLNPVFFPGHTNIFIKATYLFVILGLICSILFLRTFLNTKTSSPTLDRILKSIAIFMIPVYGILFLNNFLFLNILFISISVATVIMIYTGLRSYRKFVYARIYTNAWIIYIFTILLFSLQFFNIIPFISNYILEIGHAFEATLISLALSYKMKELHYKASRDHLTGLFNRSSFQEYLVRQIELYKIHHDDPKKLSIILIDIDHFKTINDHYGHNAGDRILQEIALLIPNKLRINDFFCRWGGDEFVIIAPETPIENAKFLAEKIQNLIEEYKFSIRKKVTVSVGVAMHENDESLRDFFHRADEALYRAKASGRNLVRVSE